ncbi:hypothetical protein AB5I41_08580 [Sphingomonas sp. MMS24-JH45]
MERPTTPIFAADEFGLADAINADEDVMWTRTRPTWRFFTARRRG